MTIPLTDVLNADAVHTYCDHDLTEDQTADILAHVYLWAIPLIQAEGYLIDEDYLGTVQVQTHLDVEDSDVLMRLTKRLGADDDWANFVSVLAEESNVATGSGSGPVDAAIEKVTGAGSPTDEHPTERRSMAISDQRRQLEIARQVEDLTRTLAHATATVPSPADSYTLLAELKASIDHLNQVCRQLSTWHAGVADGLDYEGEDARGDGATSTVIAAADLEHAVAALSTAYDAINAAHTANGRVRWRAALSDGESAS